MPSHFFHGRDISEMMRVAIRSHLDIEQPDAVLNIETHLFNTVLTAESCEYDLDVGKHVWLNKGRWSRLIKEYVPKEPLERFLSQAKEIVRGDARLGATANMMFRDPKRYDKKHRWGGCLMGATFRGDNERAGPAELTFYSRTTYIGYMGLLDAAIGHIMSLHIPCRPIKFRWYISSQQMHCFKSLPYIYSQPDLMNKLACCIRFRNLKRFTPTWCYLATWYRKVVHGWQNSDLSPEEWLQSEKYGPFRRIKRRWLEYQKVLKKNVPPSLPVSELTFEKAE